jgi:hypothetical protein
MRKLMMAWIAMMLTGMSAIAAPVQPTISSLSRQVLELSKELKAVQGRIAKHAWPDLTLTEKSAITAVLKTLPKDVKFDIECNTASCDDLAEDIDDALEAAGFDSVLDRSVGPLGYGVAVMVNAADHSTAESAIAALKSATSGRLAPPLMIAAPNANPPGYVTIVIGKYRPH